VTHTLVSRQAVIRITAVPRPRAMFTTIFLLLLNIARLLLIDSGPVVAIE
jgi:hypothetical protein